VALSKILCIGRAQTSVKSGKTSLEPYRGPCPLWWACRSFSKAAMDIRKRERAVCVRSIPNHVEDKVGRSKLAFFTS
jgi:hypothetical protein